MDESYFYFGLKVSGLEVTDGDWNKKSQEIVDYVQSELNILVKDLAREGIKIRTVYVDQEGRVDD